MSLPYVLAQGILVGKVMPDDKTNWKVLIPYTCQFLIGNVRRKKPFPEEDLGFEKVSIPHR